MFLSQAERSSTRALRPRHARNNNEVSLSKEGKWNRSWGWIAEGLIRTFTVTSRRGRLDSFCGTGDCTWQKFHEAIYLCGLITDCTFYFLHLAQNQVIIKSFQLWSGPTASSCGHTLRIRILPRVFLKFLRCWIPLPRKALNVSSLHWC